MRQHSQYHITCEFEYKQTWYIAYLCPYYELSEREIQAYKIRKYNYVVHLFSLEGFKTFEMFPDEQLQWTTDTTSVCINRGIVEIINYVLTNAFR